MENTTYCGSSAATISCIHHSANALLVRNMLRLKFPTCSTSGLSINNDVFTGVFKFGLAAQKIDDAAAPQFLAIRLANHSAGNTT